MPSEIIVQRGHRNAYDRQLRNVGARLVEVGYPANEGIGATLEWQLEAAFGERTVAVSHLACADHLGLPLERVCEIAHAHGVRCSVDAAAELPPRENLRRFTAAGADAVCFSGGKAIRGPQGSGVLRATTHALARSVRLQALDMDVDADAWRAREGAEPPHHGLGRGFKVGPEEIAGLATALQEFGERDLDAEAADAADWLATLPGEVVTDRGFWPQLVVAAGDRAEAIAAELAAADPAVIVPHARGAGRRDRDLPRGDPSRRPRPRRVGTARCDRLGAANSGLRIQLKPLGRVALRRAREDVEAERVGQEPRDQLARRCCPPRPAAVRTCASAPFPGATVTIPPPMPLLPGRPTS